MVHVRALPVFVVETTAAGDALNGALAVAFAPYPGIG
jgi:sugar/nucleoside kinase (ribokinase family)